MKITLIIDDSIKGGKYIEPNIVYPKLVDQQLFPKQPTEYP
jgi:hypothetical protein